MKLWIKTLIKDFLAISLLLTVFYFAGKNYLEMVGRKIRGTGDPIGIVSDLAYYPKRQLAGEDYINNLTIQDDLYEGDEISSDSFSSIFMNLIDGTEISLENGSRIIIKLSEDTIFFDGTISALSTRERDEPLKLINLNEKNPQPIILSATSEVTIRTDDKGVFNMSVLAGEVTRGVEVIEVNEQIKIDAEGETEVNRLSYILRTPNNNSTWITFKESLPVTFTWEEPIAQQNRSLYIAMDTSFKRIVYVQDDLIEKSLEVDLLPGEYFWRVGNEEAQNFSSTGKIKILNDNPLRAVSPADKTELTYRNQAPGQTFRWEGTESARQWILKISPNSDMTNPIRNEITNYNQVKIDGIEEGQYWWQVTALYEEVENMRELSTPLPYELSITKITEITPPQLLTPIEGAVLAPEDLSEGIRFNWKGDPEISRYEILISDKPDMTSPIFNDSTIKNYFNISTDLLPGDYYWQVKTYSQEGVPLPSSEIRSFTNQEIIRQITPLVPGSNESLVLEQGDDITFKWYSSEKSNFRFRLWQIKGTEEKLIANRMVDPVELTQYIPEKGEYKWQVDILNSQGKVLLEGENQTFYVNYPFLSPQMITPVTDSYLSLIGEEFLNITWNSVAEASDYSVSLTYENEESPLWENGKYTGTAYNFPVANLREGTYTLSLQSNRSDDGKGFPLTSQPRLEVFHIDNVIIYESPEILTPRAGLVINRLTLLKNGLNLRWKSTFDFPSYQVNLIEANTGNVLYQKLTSKREFILENLYPGEYNIEVRGIDSKKRLSPTAITNITVSEVNSLKNPQVSSPKPRQIIDMSDRDTLDFAWTHEEEGVFYNLSLADARGVTIFSRENYTQNNYTFDDLSKLDVGQFFFTIEAVKNYNDVGIKRTSPVMTIPFEITITAIEKVPVITSPEVQYAN